MYNTYGYVLNILSLHCLTLSMLGTIELVTKYNTIILNMSIQTRIRVTYYTQHIIRTSVCAFTNIINNRSKCDF